MVKRGKRSPCSREGLAPKSAWRLGRAGRLAARPVTVTATSVGVGLDV
jgi:hypothetical protein